MSKEAIIDKIIGNANTRKESIMLEAESKAYSIIENTQKSIDAANDQFDAETPSFTAEVIRRKASGAELAVRLYELELKQNAVKKVYDGVLAKLRAMKGDAYVAFLVKLLLDNAEQGERLAPSKRDRDAVKRALADKRVAALRLELIRDADIADGFVLSTDKYDKTVTLAEVVDSIRDKSESKVTDILFGEKK